MDQANAPSKVKLGRSNLDASKICFGASGLGSTPLTYGYSVDEASAHSTLRVIFDSPINFLDTSRNYGSGRSEERLAILSLNVAAYQKDLSFQLNSTATRRRIGWTLHRQTLPMKR